MSKKKTGALVLEKVIGKRLIQVNGFGKDTLLLRFDNGYEVCIQPDSSNLDIVLTKVRPLHICKKCERLTPHLDKGEYLRCTECRTHNKYSDKF